MTEESIAKKHGKPFGLSCFLCRYNIQLPLKSNYLQYALAMATLRNDSAWAWAVI